MATKQPQKKAENTARLPSCDDLNKVLDDRIEHPERADEIDEKIRTTFERERTIFVLDMSGFSRAVQRYGIIHYLAMIRKMRRVVEPTVVRNHGLVIKFEADNCFAVFDHPEQGVQASLDIRHDLDVANLMTSDESDIHVSIGIGHGPVLLTCDDLYGNELNLASKLGEDVAERGEILLTEAARRLIENPNIEFQMFPLNVSGVSMKAFRLRLPAPS